jgi:hypothetical protein
MFKSLPNSKHRDHSIVSFTQATCPTKCCYTRSKPRSCRCHARRRRAPSRACNLNVPPIVHELSFQATSWRAHSALSRLSRLCDSLRHSQELSHLEMPDERHVLRSLLSGRGITQRHGDDFPHETQRKQVFCILVDWRDE